MCPAVLLPLNHILAGMKKSRERVDRPSIILKSDVSALTFTVATELDGNRYEKNSDNHSGFTQPL